MDHDPADVEPLLRRHGRSLRRLAFELVHDAAAADDAVQETWLRTLRRPPQRTAQAHGWLATVLRHVVFRTRRDERRRTRREQAVAREPSAGDPVEVVTRAELAERVLAAVRGLDEPYRGAVWQRYFEELPPSAIAAKDGVPLATVKSRLQRGLQQLRARLGEEGESSDWRGALALAFGFDLPKGTATAGTIAVVTGGVTMAMWTKVAAAVVVVGVAAWWWWPGGEVGIAGPGSGARGEVVAAQGAIERQRAAVASATAPPPVSRERVTVHDDRTVAKPDDTARIRGRCVDETGSPLAGGTVQLRGLIRSETELNRWLRDHDAPPPLEHSVATHTDGTFALQFDALPVLRFQLTIGHEARVGGYAHWDEIDRGQDIDLGDVVLARGVLLTGILVDTVGVPVAGARLTASGSTGGTAEDEAQLVRTSRSVTVVTDEHGRFRTRRPLPVGACSVVHHRPGPVPIGEFELLPDRSVEDVRLVTQLPPAADTIRGRVVDRDGMPIAKAGFFLHVTAGHSSARSEADGRFTLLRPADVADEVVATVRAKGCVAAQTEPLAWGSQDVEVVLQRCAPLVVRVVGPDDLAVARYSVSVVPRDRRAGFQSEYAVRTRGPFDDGTAVVTDVEPGAWTLVLQYPTTSGLLTSFTPIEVTAEPLRLEMRAELPVARWLRVAMRDGSPVAGTRVQVCNLVDGLLDENTFVLSEDVFFSASTTPNRALFVWEGHTHADGRVELRGPGSQRVGLALLGPGHVPLRVPDVSLTDATELQVTVDAGGRLTGRIEPPEAVGALKLLQRMEPSAAFSRERVPSVRIHRRVGDRNESWPAVGQKDSRFELDEHGRFDLDGVAPGVWRVSVSAYEVFPGDGDQSTTVGSAEAIVTAGATTNVAIDLTHMLPGTLEATVMENDRPLAGADIWFCGSFPDTPGGVSMFRRLVHTDANGTFTHVGKPGEYSVELRTQSSSGRDAGAVPLLPKVQLVRGEIRRQTFSVWSGRMRVRLTDAAGAPAGDVTLWLDDGASTLPRPLPPTDANGILDTTLATGTVRLFVLPKGRLSEDGRRRLQLGMPDPATSDLLTHHRLDLGTVTVTTEQPTELELRLPAAWNE